ncbi:MAG: hypothetical protein IPH88_12695 [Bacteroidales bacterium]|nr:hypothetical protein [Bacteroidales bacterium]
MNGFCQFKNYWFFNTGMNLDGESLDRSQLRGGPAFLTPGGVSTWIGASTDSRKKLNLEANGHMYIGFDNYFRTHGFSFGGTYKPLNSLSVSLYPDYSFGFNDLQYVAEEESDGEPRYVLARLDQQSLGLSMRLNYTITPDLTVQFYGQPFLFAGKYSEYKIVTDPRASEYGDRLRNLTEGEDLNQNEDGVWEVDENHDGIIDYTFENENFNFLQFRSNLVIRWEYRPGSSLYLVWSQGRTENSSYGDFGLKRDARDLFEKDPQDVFLLKVSYMLVF